MQLTAEMVTRLAVEEMVQWTAEEVEVAAYFLPHVVANVLATRGTFQGWLTAVEMCLGCKYVGHHVR